MLFEFAHICSGHEHAVAGASQHDDADVLVLRQFTQRLGNLLGDRQTQGIANFRPIDRQPRNVAASFYK